MGDLTFALMVSSAFLVGMADTKISDFRVGDIEIRVFTPTFAGDRFGTKLKDGFAFTKAGESEWPRWLYEDGGCRTTDRQDFTSSGELFE